MSGSGRIGPPIGPPYWLSLSTQEPTQENQHEASGGNYARVPLDVPAEPGDTWGRVVVAWANLTAQEFLKVAPPEMVEAMSRATPEEIDAAIAAIDPERVNDIIRRADEIRRESQR